MTFPTLTIDLGENLKEIEILGLGDVHYGSPEHNEKLFNEIIKKIETQENLYCVLLGDLIECITRDSVGDIYSQVGTPQQQARNIIEKLKPIKHKILAMTGGNHENRIYKTSGFDINYLIAKGLNIEDRYIRNSFVLFLRFGKIKSTKNKPHVFSLFVTHGVSGSTKKPSKLKALIDLKEMVYGCDVYIMGHVHDYICTYEENFSIDTRLKKVEQNTSCFISQGAFLDFGGYGYEKGYKPLAQRFGIIVLGYKQHDTYDEKYVLVKG